MGSVVTVEDGAVFTQPTSSSSVKQPRRRIAGERTIPLMAKKAKTLPELKWELRELQKKLKKLGVAPPPPQGKPVLANIMSAGRFYAVPARREDTERYTSQLRAVLEAQGEAWTAKAYLHNVLAAALEAAPEPERLERPHARVAARPVIDNLGYLSLALLAASEVGARVPSAERARFTRWLELGQRVAAGEPMSASDEALLDRELPYVRQPSRAHSRNFTATTPALLVAQGVGLEAEEADARNVGGKGARQACAAAVSLLSKPGEARRFLEKLDALIQLEDAKLQFSKVSERPSSPLVAVPWRGADAGKTSHWLVELANGHHALLWKVKGKWRLVEGSREDALASVPDAKLKGAVDALSRLR